MEDKKDVVRFTILYIIIALIGALLLCAILFYNAYDNKEIILCISYVEVLLVALYIAGLVCLLSIHKSIKKVSNDMQQFIQNKSVDTEEVFMDGDIGELYTNYYKILKMLKQSEDKQIKEKEFLRDIISDISHQLKTPLASLMVFVDLLYDDKLTDASERQKVLSEAGNQLNRMEWLVLSMLKLARIEAESIVFDKEDVDILPVIKEAYEAVRIKTEEKQQNVLIDCDESFCMKGDRAWLCEALINLLKNASDYTNEGGHIKLHVEASNIYARIEVEDDGIGISNEDIQHIFERFYKGHQEVNPNSIGIGLALVKSIVNGMGGQIHVDSELGEYTRFVLMFPK